VNLILKVCDFLQYEPPRYWPIYIVEVVGGAKAMATLELCFDCREEGGSLTRPVFLVVIIMNRIVYIGLKYVRYSITNNHIKKINTDMFLSTF